MSDERQEIFEAARARLRSLEGQRDVVKELAPSPLPDAGLTLLVESGAASAEERQRYTWQVLRNTVESDWYAAVVDRIGGESAITITQIAIEYLHEHAPAKLLTHMREEVDAMIRVIHVEAERLGMKRIEKEDLARLRQALD